MPDHDHHQTPYLPTLAALTELKEAISEPRIIVDKDETIVMLNEAASDLLGYESRDLVGRPLDVLRPEDRAAQLDELRKAWAETRAPGALGRGMDIRARRADGTEVPIDLAVLPWTTDEGDFAVIALHDLTAAQHDNRLFRALLNSAPDAVLIIDDTGVIRLANQAADRVFGYSQGQLLGQPLEVLVPDRFVDRHQQLRTGFGTSPHPRMMGTQKTLRAKRKDGSEFPVDISLAPVTTEEGPLVIADVHDLTDRFATIDAMHRAEEQQELLAEMARAKDQFLATVSHELRTPLTAIIGFCELISELDDLDPEVEHYLGIVTRNARREARLVEDLLTLVNIQDGRLAVGAATVDLTRLVRDAVNSAKPQAEAAGVALQWAELTEPVVVSCDPDRIGQALDCLLSNAVKFTPAGGNVLARVGIAGTRARIEVTDTGIGISGPDPNRVFERLYRTPTAIAREIPGAGLGLSIAAAIVAAHRGEIRVVTTGPGGTTFAIDLPIEGHPEATIAPD